MSFFPEEPLHLTAHDGFGYLPSYPGHGLKNNRYKVIGKLGYGPRSSVWLVVDSDRHHDMYFAVQVLTTHETALWMSPKSNGLDVLTLASSRGYLNLYDTFVEKSHHGDHLCLVLDVAGFSYEHLRLSSPTKALSRHIVQRGVAGALEELGKLHDCGLIHGALTASNMVFETAPTISMINFAFTLVHPSCTIVHRVTVSGVEYPLVHSRPVPNGIEWNASWADINRCLVILLNLGHAQKIKDTPTWDKSHMDKSFRPPEVILGRPYSSKVDVWMLGCAVYHMLTGQPLVPDEMAANDGTMLGWLIAMSGHTDYRTTPDTALIMKYFSENGSFKLGIPDETLESRLVTSGVVSADDIPGIAQFIQACLTLDPTDRPSPRDLFWTKWVEPGLES